MKFILTFILFFSAFQLTTAQKYSRVKVLASEQELSQLSNLGIPMDHGIRKKNTFLISDFSEAEIQILQDYGFEYEIQIDNVKLYYKNRLNKPNAQGSYKNEN